MEFLFKLYNTEKWRYETGQVPRESFLKTCMFIKTYVLNYNNDKTKIGV